MNPYQAPATAEQRAEKRSPVKWMMVFFMVQTGSLRAFVAMADWLLPMKQLGKPVALTVFFGAMGVCALLAVCAANWLLNEQN